MDINQTLSDTMIGGIFVNNDSSLGTRSGNTEKG